MANPIKIIKGVSKAIGKSNAKSSTKKANARGLKAAKKPLSKGNKKLVNKIDGQTFYIGMDRRPTPPTVKAAWNNGKKDGGREAFAAAKKIAMREARSNGPAKKISPAQKALNKRMGK